jgi:hypothetical protein
MLQPRNADTIAALGLVYHREKDFDKAIMLYHESLAIEAENPVYLELLDSALSEFIDKDPLDITSILATQSPKPNIYQKYFDERNESTKKVRNSASKKENGALRSSGMITRSQQKNLLSDPFLDDSPKRNEKSGKPKLFQSPFQSVNTPNKEPIVKASLKYSPISDASPFISTPVGGSGNLFFSPPVRNRDLEAIKSDDLLDEDVDMEIDDL